MTENYTFPWILAFNNILHFLLFSLIDTNSQYFSYICDS